MPPYADKSLTPEELSTGVCFASGGTGYDPQTPELVVSRSTVAYTFQVSNSINYLAPHIFLDSFLNDVHAHMQSVISMSEQLNQFKEYIGKLKASFGEKKTNFILANSLFLVVAGSDDIANTYFTIGIRKAEYDVPAYTDLMVNSATSFLQVGNYI